jgi:glycosyltransferase involved in cell wall biosynthesis
MMMPKFPAKLAFLATHPIQHFVPFYRALAEHPELELRVFFCSRIGLTSYFDQEMATELRWNMDLTSGYEHVFLPEADNIHATGFWTLNNPSVATAFRTFAPDALAVYGYSNVTVLRAIAWAVRADASILMISDSELVQARSWHARVLKWAVLPRLLRYVSGFLTVGDNNEAYWLHYGVPRERLFRVPFTIDEGVFVRARAERSQLAASFRAEHGIAANDIVFLTVGKLSRRKRQADVIAAMAVLAREDRVNARLILAGDGTERPLLEKMAADTGMPAAFLGFVNVDKLPPVYAAADVLVHPSEQDPHPLVLSEAACVGLPVIVSDRVGAVGPTDIVQPGVNGLTYPVGDIHSLADAMRRLALDDALRRSMAAKAVEVFATQNIQVSVRGMLAAVDAVLARKGTRTTRAQQTARGQPSVPKP